MTNEEKAKAYDEAIEKIKGCSTDKYGCLLGIKPSDIFPQLSESKDERIRKAILGLTYLDGIEPILTKCSITAGDIRAYLEKQKEHPTSGSSEKPNIQWSEEYREEDLQARFAFYTYKDEDGVLYLSNVFVEETSRNKGFGTKILQAAEKVAETIGAISIRLKVKQGSLANNWYRKHGYGYITFEDGYDWLEKTLEYLKPAKQEWNEEDEKILDELLDYCNTENATWYNWLKSLRLRSHWKPSEAQIEALKYALGYGGNYSKDALYSLFIELGKL